MILLQYTVSAVSKVFLSIPIDTSHIPIQQYGNKSGYNTESKNTTLNQLRMLQYFLKEQIFLNIFHQPL